MEISLKELRQSRELTQEQAVEGIGWPGLSQSRLSIIEAGLMPAEALLRARIAGFYGVAIETIWPQLLATTSDDGQEAGPG